MAKPAIHHVSLFLEPASRCWSFEKWANAAIDGQGCLSYRLRNVPARKKIRASLRKPGHQAYLRVPSIPSVAWQPYPSPLGRLRAHSFASPSRDGFAGSRMPRHKNCRGQPKLRTVLPRMQVFRELFSKKTPSTARHEWIAKRRTALREFRTPWASHAPVRLSSLSQAAGMGRQAFSSAKCQECRPSSPRRHEK